MNYIRKTGRKFKRRSRTRCVVDSAGWIAKRRAARIGVRRLMAKLAEMKG